MKVRPCLRCGCDVPQPKTSYRLRCQPCVRQTQLDRLAAKRLAAGIVPIGGMTGCDRCGAQIVKGGGYKQLCPACRDIRRQEVLAKSSSRPEYIEAQRKREAARVRITDSETRRRWTANQTAKRRADPKRRLDHRVGQLVRGSLKAGKGGRKWEQLVGYTIDDLALHLERQFLPKMSWDNMGEWHIDHIIPKSSFDYQTPDDDAFKAAWALTNLRPLWSSENLRKKAKRLHLI